MIDFTAVVCYNKMIKVLKSVLFPTVCGKATGIPGKA